MDVVNIVSSVGFPIAACFVLAVYVKSLTDRMFSVIEKFNEAVNGLTDKVDDLIEKEREYHGKDV